MRYTFAIGRAFGAIILLSGLMPGSASAADTNPLAIFLPFFFLQPAQANDQPPEDLFRSKRVTSSTICQIIVTQVLGGAKSCRTGNAREPDNYRIKVARDDDNMLLFHVTLLARSDQLAKVRNAMFELYDLDVAIDRTKTGTAKISASISDGMSNPVVDDGLWSGNNPNNSDVDKANFAKVEATIESGMTEYLTGVMDNCQSISDQQDLSLALQSCLLTSQP